MKINNVIKSKKNKIINKLFVKINWSRRVRPKAGDILGLKLFIILGILDTIFAVLFLAWMISSVIFGLGNRINILGLVSTTAPYLLAIIIPVMMLFRIGYDMYIRNFKGVVGGVIFIAILIYAIYKFHYLL